MRNKAIDLIALGCAGLMVAGCGKTLHVEDVAAVCQNKLPPTKVRVHVDLPAPVELHNLSLRQLRELTPFSRATGSVLGVTRLGSLIQHQFGLNTIQTAGSTCSRPEVDITLTAREYTVNIAKEIPENTCLYRDVQAHEARHVALNLENYTTAARQIEQEMTVSFGDTIHYGNPSELQAQLEAAIVSSWIPKLQSELAELDQRHLIEIDTKQEKIRTSLACDREALPILAAAHAGQL